MLNLFLKLVILLAFMITGCSSSNNTTNETEIDATKMSTPEEQGMDSETLEKMLKYMDSSEKDFHSVLVYRNNQLVTESYFYPYHKDVKHSVNSVTKSIVSTLIGIAIEDQKLGSINEKVVDLFPEMQLEHLDDQKKDITVENLLTMSSGLQWVDHFQYGAPDDSTTKMDQSPNAIKYVLDQPVVTEPGTKFYYHNGVSQTLSGIIHHHSGQTTFDYAKEKLFHPLGITNLDWIMNQNGIHNGGGGLIMIPRDMGKIGLLFLNHGSWNGKQLISEEWVKEATMKHIDTIGVDPGEHGYGYQWWMNSFGGYSARGIGGQFIFVLPEENLVVVFTSKLENRDFLLPERLVEKFIIPAIKSDEAIEANPNGYEMLETTVEKIAEPNEAIQEIPLPEIAESISGKTYSFDHNPINIQSFSLTFNGKNEAILKLAIGGFDYEFPVGLDDVYRVNNPSLEEGPFGMYNMMALKGKWINESTFEVDMKHAYQNDLQFHFDGIEVTLTVEGIPLNGKRID